MKAMNGDGKEDKKRTPSEFYPGDGMNGPIELLQVFLAAYTDMFRPVKGEGPAFLAFPAVCREQDGRHADG